MDAYQEHVARKREPEAARAARSRAVPGPVKPRPRPEPERRVDGWAVFWAVALAVWLAVEVVFIAADTSDPETGDVCGIYLFESDDALREFRESELAKSIPIAYDAVDVRREAYDVLYELWPERGPYASARQSA